MQGSDECARVYVRVHESTTVVAAAPIPAHASATLTPPVNH